MTPTVAGGVPGNEIQAATVDGGFVPGQQARNATSSRVNIRRTPGYLSKRADDVIGQIQPGERVEIIGPPMGADNLLWWQIRYPTATGQTIEGWVAEATASGVVILDAIGP